MKKEQERKIKKLPISHVKWSIFGNNEYFSLKRRLKSFFHDHNLYCRRVKFLKKHGCAEPAFWETDAWFIAVFKDILDHYRNHRIATPFVLEGPYDFEHEDEYINKNEQAWNTILDNMIELLNKMDEDYWWLDVLADKMTYAEMNAKVEEAKNEFFKLFSKYFYNLWE